MNLEERVADAIVQKFFEPAWTMSTQQVVDPSTGQYRTELVPYQTSAPMSMVAQAVYDQAKADIIERVIRQIDIDAIVEQWAPVIAKDVVEQLQVKDGYGWQPHPSKTERQKMLDKVYNAVAEEFGRQCVEHLKSTGGLLNILEASPSNE